jgi:hypothetical protein
MKLVSSVLENIEGIHIFYIVGLLIFVTLFVVILIRTLRRPDSEMIEIKNSILTESDTEELKT